MSSIPRGQSLVGLVFNSWEVISGPYTKTSASAINRVIWECRCKCGAISFLIRCDLTSGKSRSCKSCGMRNVFKHGYSRQNTPRERLYRTWKNMRNRCNNPAGNDIPNYGGRGIRVCDEWNEYS